MEGLSSESFHHDACGLGVIARADGRDSREIVEQGLVILSNLNHRGTVNADGETGDGAGILVQVPDMFFRKQQLGFDLPLPGSYAVGTCFFWDSDDNIEKHQQQLAQAVHEEGQFFLGWRDVPVDESGAGPLARSVAPRIRQFFVESCESNCEAFERKLYVIRRRIHRTIERFYGPGRFYVVSLSSKTLVYKGLLQGIHVSTFFPDLKDPSFTSALAMVHSRFSTNTLGNWSLAHPYRYIAHNGEINTLRGNLNWMRARESQFGSELFGDDMAKLRPIIEPRVSDSAAFDNALEFLHLGGRSLPQAIMTMVPEAWENNHTMSADRRAFYHYSTALMQAWDGPAAIAFTNGNTLGAVLDRNGLRPARYAITKDNVLVLASEDGVLPIDAGDISERWRLGPGRMVVLDLDERTIQHDNEAKSRVVSAHPYRQWVFDNAVGLGDPGATEATNVSEDMDLVLRQRIFGYTYEDVRLLLTPMATTGKEADGSMGTDTPLAVLSNRPRLLFDYFHQLFAQVTNPPIDPLRERAVMSLRVSIGAEHNLLEDGAHHARRIVLPHPILRGPEMARLKALTDPAFRTTTLSLLWAVEDGPAGLRRALNRLCEDAIEAVQSGATILILSDRHVSATRLAIPVLLATGAVYQHLTREGLGGSVALIAETAEARETHHIAALLACGARAVNPYLALESIGELADSGKLGDIDQKDAKRHYVDALNKGVLKIISKMGISTVHSYTGSQLFEIIGLGEDVVERCFTGAISRLGGLHLEDIGRECLQRFNAALDISVLEEPVLDPGGEYQFRDGKTSHQWNNTTVPTLQHAVRTNDFATWEEFSRACDDEVANHSSLRSLLRFRTATSIDIDEVEPATEIVKRFNTGAMSLGSLSFESHEALAVAMNRIGGRSNSGEGGEDAKRFVPDENGDLKRSAIKQVASGRFGVTTHYLVNADVIQIKVAQGAKPGEGGQLPGHKVSVEIAALRNSTAGVGLISPPPHHDIYSIEDLSQLIFDLHMVNPSAWVSVKLVAEAGVGTIAAGVAKAKADHITISGHDGGTGAAALTSIKHAGLPWELGLAEAQQVLVSNDLRARVRLQVDGMLRTGRDVVVGAMLGADEFGFSTAPLIAMGCVMMRVCHLNTCPVGIATQDPVLRARFRGQPEHVINYFFFVAEEVRRIMASLGLRTFDELVGRADLLTRNTNAGNWKTRDLDLEPILHMPVATDDWRSPVAQQHGVDNTFDAQLLPDIASLLDADAPISITRDITNIDRSAGTQISGYIAKRFGAAALPDERIQLHLTGVAGQSFGAWGNKGLSLRLTGTTNDYAGKGLSGALISVRPPHDAAYDAGRSVITGNVALYGATSGQAFFAGMAGERFAVRNSGATAVVEGVGDHGCEYMTGGTVVVLGPTGRNFAAGMSGGFAYVWEPAMDLRSRLNKEMVSLQPLTSADADIVEALLRRHVEETGSVRAQALLSTWQQSIPEFVKVVPDDYAKAMAAAQKEAVSHG